MDLVFTLVMSFASRNVNRPHRISLNSQWKIDGRLDPNDPSQLEISSVRTFHRPSGVSIKQIIRFCFEPASTDIHFSINDIQQPLSIRKGLATVPITGMMESFNRVELRWRGAPLEKPQLPEHFAAWIEISDDSPLDL